MAKRYDVGVLGYDNGAWVFGNLSGVGLGKYKERWEAIVDLGIKGWVMAASLSKDSFYFTREIQPVIKKGVLKCHKTDNLPSAFYVQNDEHPSVIFVNTTEAIKSLVVKGWHVVGVKSGAEELEYKLEKVKSE